MLNSLTYFQKLFIIQFFLYGGIYATLMWLIEMDDYSAFEFMFNFLFFGGLMAFTMLWIEKRSLNKQGVFELNASTMNANQTREVATQFTKVEFYEFWKNSKTYNSTQKEDGSLVVGRKYYTSEFKAPISVSYVEGAQPKMILKSIPKKWVQNDLALIHRTIKAVKEYAEKEYIS